MVMGLMAPFLTVVWQFKKVENASGKTPEADGCNGAIEPSQGQSAEATMWLGGGAWEENCIDPVD